MIGNLVERSLPMKWWYRMYFCLTAGILLLFGGMIVLRQERDFSENENRILASLPVFHLRDFWTGDFQKELEQAADDQMPGRDRFTALAAGTMRRLGYRDIGGAYLGSEQTYLSKITEDDIEMFQYMENLRYVEYLSRKYPQKLSLMLVPSAGTVLKDRMPKYAPFYHANSMYHAAEVVCETTEVLDLREPMRRKNREFQKEKSEDTVYYRTDHHWTLAGAYQGYAAFADAGGWKPLTYEEFQPEIVSETFYGTLYSKVLDQKVKPDIMYAAKNIEKTTDVVCDGNKRKSVYDAKKLKTKDKYAYFFGGNYGEVRIRTNAQQGGTLVIFKDSFANSMVPFLLQDYEEIVLIDLRYYRRSVEEFLEQTEDAEILVLYEMSNFAQDTNLVKLSK